MIKPTLQLDERNDCRIIYWDCYAALYFEKSKNGVLKDFILTPRVALRGLLLNVWWITRKGGKVNRNEHLLWYWIHLYWFVMMVENRDEGRH